MLSRSQARFLFLAATLLFSLVFLGLTVDTIRLVPSRSREENLTPEVVRGKRIWDENNCMGCHTLLGEGAYYAPELTKVYERRGPEWMRVFLKDPKAMFPGQRRMVKYDFSEEDLDALIAFFRWVGEIDTNGFPRDPDLAPASAEAQASTGASPPSKSASSSKSGSAAPPRIYSTICQACHAVGGKGGTVGPALDGVATRFSEEELDAWLKDPQAVKPGTTMPNLGLSDDDRGALVRWLSTLR